MKTIVYCIASTYNSGGKDRVIVNKANWLVKAGYRVHLITTDQAGRPPYFPLDDAVMSHDLAINYERTNNLPIASRLWQKRRQAKEHRRKLQLLLDTIKPDILISTLEEDGAIIASLQLSCPKIAELHYSKERRYNEYARGTYDWRKLLDYWRTKKDEWIVKRYDHLVVLTDRDLEVWQCMPRRSAIPNPLSFTIEEVSGLKNKVVLAVGRLSYEKNFTSLLRIWKLLHSAYPDWKLEIVGNGYQRSSLEALSQDLGISSSVTLTPSTSCIQDKYLSASIFALTSLYEGFSLVLLEAMSCGIPVVSYDCPYGPRGIIAEEKVGYLVDLGDEKVFAERLMALMSDEEHRLELGKTAKLHSRKYGIDNIMALWVELFTSFSK